MISDTVIADENLLRSRCVSSAVEVIELKDSPGAATSYNSAIDRAQGDILVFAHQDVYFPAEWMAQLESSIEFISGTDPNWGVLGIWGIAEDGSGYGHLYCNAVQKELGVEFQEPIPVLSLDEVVLILRKSSGLRFDEGLPGFHMYGIDICLEARRRGLNNYAISAYCIHNTNGYSFLPIQFWRSYLFIRKKWKEALPIRTSCIDITKSAMPILLWNVRRVVAIARRRHQPGRRRAGGLGRVCGELGGLGK